MMNNLDKNNNIDICEIKIIDNIIKIEPDYDKCEIIDLYMILYSYIRSNLGIRKISLYYENKNIMWYNITYINMFDYIEFKIWWYKFENNLLFEEDSKIDFVVINKKIVFEIYLFDNDVKLYPIYPWDIIILNKVKPN